MKNHTPAPWHPHRSESGFVIVYSNGENRSHVARLFDSTLCEEHGNLELNARLIASAPDLLRALEQLLETAESLNDWLVSDGSINGEHELFKKVRAIISKAKGEA